MVDKNIMRAKTDTPAAVWAKLNLIFDSEKNSNAYFLITEGFDHLYYKKQLDNIDKTFVVVNAKGRQNIIDLFPRWETESNNFDRMLFFLDREYPSQTYLNERVFTTAKHSVENYFVSKSVMEKILLEYSSFNQSDECFSNILDVYDSNLQEFIAREWKKGVLADVLQSMEYKPSIKKPLIKFEELINFDPKSLVVNWLKDYTFETLLSIYLSEPIISALSDEDAKKIQSTFEKQIEKSKNQKEYYVRGKDALQFFVTQILAIKKASHDGLFAGKSAVPDPMDVFVSNKQKNVVQQWFRFADADSMIETYAQKIIRY